jgi:hypothetical protein
VDVRYSVPCDTIMGVIRAHGIENVICFISIERTPDSDAALALPLAAAAARAAAAEAAAAEL